MDKLFLEFLVSFLAGFLIGTIIFLIYTRITRKRRKQILQTEIDFILNKTKSQASKIERQSKQKAKDLEEESKKQIEKEVSKTKERLKEQEYKLKQKETELQAEMEAKEKELKGLQQKLNEEKGVLEISEKKLESLKENTQKYHNELSQSLQDVASMTQDEARNQLKKALEEEVRKEISDELTEIEEDLKKKSKQKVQMHIAKAMTRYAAEVTAERVMENLPITGTSTKGKIIGRDGRNIRSLQSACGVDLIIDDEIISISCFDPVRRVVAKKTLERLIKEERVYPSMIEELAEKTRREVFAQMKEVGEKTCFDVGVHDVHHEIVSTLGSLQYRFLDGQNLLKYSIEVSHIAGLLAAEIGFDVKTAKRAGLFHAIGLGVPHMVEGSYSLVGSEFCRKNGENPEICQAIKCHDSKSKPETILDNILQAAYNLSHSRSKDEVSVIEGHINRLKDLESLANSFEGVKRSFAIKSGKEIRVLVDTAKVVGDKQMAMLSRDIASKIKREVNVSGEIKVCVVREYRIVEHAR